MSAHTPGPWTINLAQRSDGGIVVAHIVTGVERRNVCQVAWFSDEQTAADARLIAAAPDLLTALAEIESLYADLVNATGTLLTPSERGAVERARAAIAKAEGRDE